MQLVHGLTTHCLPANLVVAVVVGVEEVEEELWSIDSTKAAILVDKVSKLFEVGLIISKHSAALAHAAGLPTHRILCIGLQRVFLASEHVGGVGFYLYTKALYVAAKEEVGAKSKWCSTCRCICDEDRLLRHVCLQA